MKTRYRILSTSALALATVALLLPTTAPAAAISVQEPLSFSGFPASYEDKLDAATKVAQTKAVAAALAFEAAMENAPRGNADTPEITQLSTNIDEGIQMLFHYKNTSADLSSLLGLRPSDPEVQAENIANVDKKLEAGIASVQTQIDLWKAAVDTENARLEAARIEAARIEAERLEAERIASLPQGEIPAPQAGGSDETPEERVQRISASLPFSVPTVVAMCTSTKYDPSIVLGCYVYGDHFITISPVVLASSDCRVRKTIAHEYRHYWQYLQGWQEFDENGQLDVEFLEADATIFSLSYDC